MRQQGDVSVLGVLRGEAAGRCVCPGVMCGDSEAAEWRVCPAGQVQSGVRAELCCNVCVLRRQGHRPKGGVTLDVGEQGEKNKKTD